MKQKTFLAGIFSLLAVAISLVGINAYSGFDMTRINADNQNYAIVFNSTKNKFFAGTGSAEHSGDAIIKTELDNEIGFAYHNMAGGSSSSWHLSRSGSYFYNTDPIHGLTELTIQCATSDREYSILWGSDLSFSLGEYTFTSSTSLMSFDFDNSYPTFFKFINKSDSNIAISNMMIKLDCVNYYPSVNVTSENETMGTVSGGGIKSSGSNVTIVATPNKGYRFVGWYSDGEFVSDEESYTFAISYSDLSFEARFTYEKYNFVVETESIVKGSVINISGQYDYLENISVNAIAETGYTFSGWYNGSTLVSTDNPFSFSMPYNDITYTAHFSTNYYDIDLTNSNPSLGSIAGSGHFQYGSNVTIFAYPNTGVTFVGWFDEKDDMVSQSASYSFIMPHEDLHYTAKFEWVPHNIELTVNDDQMGSVTGSGYYHYNQSVTLNAYPTEHHSFFGWYEGETLLSQDSSYTFDMPNNSISYTAKFVKNYSLIVYSDDESMGTVTAPEEWGVGLEVTVVSHPNVGYAIDFWGDENYNELCYSSSYTFTMPEHDVELIASFGTGYVLDVRSSDASKGTVTGSDSYLVGRSVTVSTTTHRGIYKGWFDENNNCLSTDTTYTFNMPAHDYSLEARYMTDEEETERAWKIEHGIIPSYDSSTNQVTYGMYPKTHVSSSSIISALNKVTPDGNGWCIYNGDYYYRALSDIGNYSENRKFEDGTIIQKDTYYWYRCEPIKWRILTCNNTDEYFLLSEIALDACMYYTDTAQRTIDGNLVYCNNYKYSTVRELLTGFFYSKAFYYDNSYIKTTVVDNMTNSYGTVGSAKYVCENTNDKVFMPSYKDYTNNDYGFPSNGNDYTETRQCSLTDYAEAKDGGVFGNGKTRYWTRSPHSWETYAVCFGSNGESAPMTVNTKNAVRPAITFKISSFEA